MLWHHPYQTWTCQYNVDISYTNTFHIFKENHITASKHLELSKFNGYKKFNVRITFPKVCAPGITVTSTQYTFPTFHLVNVPCKIYELFGPFENTAVISRIYFSNPLYRIIALLALILLLNATGIHPWEVKITQWHGVVGQQTTVWTSIDPYLWRHLASLGHNEF